MKKAELVQAWQDYLAAEELSAVPSIRSLDTFLDALGKVAARHLEEGGEISLPHVGKLKVRERKGRKFTCAMGPGKGKVVEVPDRRRVILNMSKELKERML